MSPSGDTGARHESAVCYVIEHQPRLANMAKFLALTLGGCARGLLGEEAALGVRPRCVQAPDEVAISLKSVDVRLKNTIISGSVHGSPK